ncbi:MAG: hypothetical protein WDN06_01235 [Asticcacaulis sp.]
MISSLKRLLKPDYADGDEIDLGDYSLRLKINPRAKAFKVRVDRHGEVVGDGLARALPAGCRRLRQKPAWLDHGTARQARDL